MKYEFGNATPVEAGISAVVFLTFAVPTAILVDNFYVGVAFGIGGSLLVNDWYWKARAASNRPPDC